MDDSGEVKEKKIQLRFIISFRFMASSLGSLANNLVKNGRKLSGFEDYSKDQYELLIREGVYSHEYMSSCDKVEETELPEVEVRYPKELHDLHNDLPFMSEKMKINGVEKLVPNLNTKIIKSSI